MCPIYEYRCAKCERTFEKLQKVSDEPLKKCELCGSEDVKKIMSTTLFKFTEPWRKKRIV